MGRSNGLIAPITRSSIKSFPTAGMCNLSIRSCANGNGFTTPCARTRLSAIARRSNFSLTGTLILERPSVTNHVDEYTHFPIFEFPVILVAEKSPKNMSLIEQIQKDLTEAMKSKDELRVSVLRMVKSALKNKEIEKMRPLESMEALQVLQTLVKQRHESVEQFTKGGREDLAAKESSEIAIIESYLPPAPNDAEITRAVEEAIADVGADSLKQMGAVIKAARAKLEGRTVDGKVLSDRVRERLS